MIPAEILPDLTPDDLRDLANWLYSRPASAYLTNRLYNQVPDLVGFLRNLADLRRKG